MKDLHKLLPHKEILDLSHHNTLFTQTLSFIPRHVFQKLEHRHKTGRSSRRFGFKEQFTVMAFIQLAAGRSMRDGLRCLSAAGSRLMSANVCPKNRGPLHILGIPKLKTSWPGNVFLRCLRAFFHPGNQLGALPVKRKCFFRMHPGHELPFIDGFLRGS